MDKTGWVLCWLSAGSHRTINYGNYGVIESEKGIIFIAHSVTSYQYVVR
jgi:hypothetical protein